MNIHHRNAKGIAKITRIGAITVVEERVQKILGVIFPSYDRQVLKDATPEQVSEWDSMNHLNLVMAINEEFDISLNFGEIMDIGSVADIIRILQEKGIE